MQSVRKQLREQAINIPGGQAEIGTDRPFIPADGEGPRRFQPLAAFALGAAAVTNAGFAAFAADTGYATEAERFGWTYVFYAHVRGVEETIGAAGIQWWRRVDGACWRSPYGPGSSAREDDPVVHVSWNDAVAFARWADARLPSEVEWEHAARGGLSHSIYPWGDRHPDDAAFFPCNIWQGTFPYRDLGRDGFRGLAPARSFAPNGYGLFNMVGNCWEWTADPAAAADAKVLKGGSHLCHASYCHRYRIAARTGNTPDTSTSHIGFRLAFDL